MTQTYDFEFSFVIQNPVNDHRAEVEIEHVLTLMSDSVIDEGATAQLSTGDVILSFSVSDPCPHDALEIALTAIRARSLAGSPIKWGMTEETMLMWVDCTCAVESLS